MSESAPSQLTACERCRAPATCVINHFIGSVPHTSPFCETCWIAARHEVGVEMNEGPLVWGEDWAEVLIWLERTLAHAESRRLRHLTAFELSRQLPHLPAPIPPAARKVLDEFGLSAS